MGSRRKQKEDKLIRRLFLSSLFVFFLSNLTSSLGSIVDGLVIGNNMNTDSLAAFSIISPLGYVFAIIGSILGSGVTAACTIALGKNEVDRAKSLFSLAFFTGVGLSVLVAIFFFLFADPILVQLGAERGSALFLSAKEYLIGYVIGLPALTATKLLSSIMPLDGDRRRTFISTVTMTLVNITGDFLCIYLFHAGLAEIALVTSISYYAAFIILMLHFRKKDAMFHLVFRRPDWKALGRMSYKGLPMGVSRVTSSINGIVVNKVLVGISAVAVAGYAVTSNLSFLVRAVILGSAQAFMVLCAVYHAEKNKRSMMKLTKITVIVELVLAGSVALLMFSGAPLIARIYLGKNSDAYAAGISAIKWTAAGLLFYGFNILFADYLQLSGRILAANLVYVLEDVLFTTVLILTLSGSFGAGGAYAAIAAANFAMFICIPLFVMIVNRRPIRKAEDFLMFGDDFNIRAADEITRSIANRNALIKATAEILEFCRRKGIDEWTATKVCLAMEELGCNIIEYGFPYGRNHSIELRLIIKAPDDITMLVRDDCRPFNPKERYKFLTTDDPTANIGIRLVMAIAKDVEYSSTLGLNNLTVKL